MGLCFHVYTLQINHKSCGSCWPISNQHLSFNDFKSLHRSPVGEQMSKTQHPPPLHITCSYTACLSLSQNPSNKMVLELRAPEEKAKGGRSRALKCKERLTLRNSAIQNTSNCTSPVIIWLVRTKSGMGTCHASGGVHRGGKVVLRLTYPGRVVLEGQSRRT